MASTYCPEFDICSDHDYAGEEEGDTGGHNGEDRTKVQRTRLVWIHLSILCAVCDLFGNIFLP